MDKAFSIIGYLLLVAFTLGWMDTLAVFGVEDSKHYTWWHLIQTIAQ